MRQSLRVNKLGIVMLVPNQLQSLLSIVPHLLFFPIAMHLINYQSPYFSYVLTPLSQLDVPMEFNASKKNFQMIADYHFIRFVEKKTIHKLIDKKNTDKLYAEPGNKPYFQLQSDKIKSHKLIMINKIILMQENQQIVAAKSGSPQNLQQPMSEHKDVNTEGQEAKCEEAIPSVEYGDHKQLESQQQQKENNEQVPFTEAVVKDSEDVQDEVTEENLQKAQQHKDKGGEYFKAGKQIQAIQQYENAIKFTSDKTLRATIYSNIAICLIKDEKYAEAKGFCLKSLKNNQSLRKPRTNLARCLQAQEKYEEALEEYKNLEKDAPANQTVFLKDKINKIQIRVDEINEKRKTEVLDGLKNIGNSVLGYFGMSLDNFKLDQGAGGGYNISFKQ